MARHVHVFLPSQELRFQRVEWTGMMNSLVNGVRWVRWVNWSLNMNWVRCWSVIAQVNELITF